MKRAGAVLAIVAAAAGYLAALRWGTDWQGGLALFVLLVVSLVAGPYAKDGHW